MRLYAVIYSPAKDKTDIQALNGLAKAKSRIDTLKTAVKESYLRFRSKYEANPVVSWQLVFLAPEYFFSNQRELNDRFFSHEVKKYILQELVALAKSYPSMLIVPGTVLWTKSDSDGTGKKKSTVDKVKARIQNAYSNFRTQVDAVEWGHRGALGATAKPEHYLDNPLTKTRIAQNVAYVLLGKEALKYHKVGNYKEVENEKGNIVFAPGGIVGRFDVGGVKYGLEICMDHAMGVFDSSVSAQGPVHIRLIVSSFVSARQVANTAVALHSSTEKQGLMRKQDGSITTTGTNPIRITPKSGARLVEPPFKGPDWTLWQIDMDEKQTGISDTWDRHFRNAKISPLKNDYS